MWKHNTVVKSLLNMWRANILDKSRVKFPWWIKQPSFTGNIAYPHISKYRNKAKRKRCRDIHWTLTRCGRKMTLAETYYYSWRYSDYGYPVEFNSYSLVYYVFKNYKTRMLRNPLTINKWTNERTFTQPQRLRDYLGTNFRTSVQFIKPNAAANSDSF